MYKRHEIGKLGEDIACDFLIKNYYEIIERNFKCKMGEIDIIAKEGNELIFVEVKTRAQNEFGTPADAVNKRKKSHIYHVAEYYLMINKIENVFCRIDVIEVYIYGDKYKINYLKNCVQDKVYSKKYYDEEMFLGYDEDEE